MLDESTRDQITQYLSNAHSVIICLMPEASWDQVASGFALASALRESGREVLLASPEPLPTNYQLVQQEVVQTQLGNRDLMVSFPYQPEAVDKVSYHIDSDNQLFNLVIKPQKGQKPLRSDEVNFSYAGAEADLIFLIGVQNLEDLQQLYFGLEQLYQTKPIITLNSFATELGTIKINTSDTSCMSESMVQLLQALGLPVTSDAATDLLAVIERQTDGFRSLTANANTFATVAELLKAGGRRTRVANEPSLATEFESPVMVESKKSKVVKNGLSNNGSSKKRPTFNVEEVGDLHYQPANVAGSTRN